MNLREIIKNADPEIKKLILEALHEDPELLFIAQDANADIFAYDGSLSGLRFLSESEGWHGWNNCEYLTDAVNLATDHATTVLNREEVVSLVEAVNE